MSTISQHYRELASRFGFDRTRRRHPALSAARPGQPYTAGSSPILGRSSEDRFARLIDICVSEVALMWILHQRALSSEARTEPLKQQILDFSSVAFRAIEQGSDHLREIKQPYLWLLYFKGLIAARTHPQHQMIYAIKLIKDRPAEAEPTAAPTQADVRGSALIGGAVPVADGETLAQIAQALTLPPRDS